MNQEIVRRVTEELKVAIAKWGEHDRDANTLLAAATEELGEVAHALNHHESIDDIKQEIIETIGILVRLYDKEVEIEA